MPSTPIYHTFTPIIKNKNKLKSTTAIANIGVKLKVIKFFR